MQRPIVYGSDTSIQHDVLSKIERGETNISRRDVRLYTKAEIARFKNQHPLINVTVETPDMTPRMLEETLPILWNESGTAIWYYVDKDRANDVLSYLEGRLNRDVTVSMYVEDKGEGEWETMDLYANSEERQTYDDPYMLQLERQQQSAVSTSSPNVDINDVIRNTVEMVTKIMTEQQQSLLEQQQQSMMEMFKELSRELHQEHSQVESTQASERVIRRIYDETNPEVTLPLRVEELAMRNYPIMFDRYSNRSDYDEMNWTWSLRDNAPYYVSRRSTPVELYDNRVAVTDAVNRVWASEAYQERFNNPLDVNYNERRASNAIRIINAKLEQASRSPSPSRASVSNIHPAGRLRQEQLASTINTFVGNAEHIPIVIGRLRHPESLTVEAFKELYPESVTVDTIRNRRVWFDGMVTESHIEVNTALENVNEYLQS